MRVTIYLNGTETAGENLREIRSQMTHCLLALVSSEGVLLWDRRSRMQHQLSIDELVALFPVEKVQAALQRRQEPV